MTTLAYSHTLVAGTPENINDVQDMFNDVKTWANGNVDATNLAATADPATLMGAYRAIAEASISFGPAAAAAQYSPLSNGLGSAIGTAQSSNNGFLVVPINLPDYAVSGLTTQFRIQASTLTNSSAPAVNFTYALAPVTGTSGTTGNFSISTIGSLLGSVTRSAPAANSQFVDTGADFTVSSSTVYVLVIVTSGTVAANANAQTQVRLQVHNI